MKCSACAATLPDDAAFCSSCGTEVGKADRAPVQDATEVALAAANLLRVRGRYEDAEKRCVEVLRSDPNNVHAHSLLGDIYRDQGKLEEAAEWYQMALDLDPNSRADREKLRQVRQRRSSVAQRDVLPSATVSTATSGQVVRWVAVALTVLFLGALAAIIVHRVRKPQQTPRETQTATRQAASTSGLPAPTPGIIASQQRTSPLPGEQMTEAQGENLQTAENDETILEREALVERVLREQNPWRSGQVSAAVILTTDGRTALLFAHGVFAPSPPQEVQVASETLRAVQLVFQSDPEVNSVEVVFRAAGEAVPYHTLLRARATRRNVADNTGAQTLAELRQAFALWRWTPNWPGSSSPLTPNF